MRYKTIKFVNGSPKLTGFAGVNDAFGMSVKYVKGEGMCYVENSEEQEAARIANNKPIVTPQILPAGRVS